MSYEIGSRIDLRHLNKKREVATERPKKSIEQATRKLWNVGSKVIFVRMFPTIETIVIAPA